MKRLLTTNDPITKPKGPNNIIYGIEFGDVSEKEQGPMERNIMKGLNKGEQDQGISLPRNHLFFINKETNNE